MNGKKQRRRKARDQKSKGTGMWLLCIKAALAGCVLTVILVLLFALLLKWETVTENVIPVVTTSIKGLCAGCAGLVCAASVEKRGWLWGGAAGGMYVALAFVAFALAEQSFAPSIGLLADMGLGLVAGGVAGMLMQLKK